MKIALVSDVHSRDGRRLPVNVSADLYVLAGDIGDPELIAELVSKLDVQVAYLPGNHEYYSYYFDDIENNVFGKHPSCYNNRSLELEDGRFAHFTTLWTSLATKARQKAYDEYLNDTRWIGQWNGERAHVRYLESLKYLYDNVQEGDLVFTHHTPSYQSVVPKWQDHPINFCFHNKLDDFIKERKPALWGHGHIHDPVDYMIGDTRVVCNPLGYRNERVLHEPYRPMILEV